MFAESVTIEQIDLLEKSVFPGRIIVIDSLGKDFDDACRYLASKKIIGFDTESRPCFSPGQHPYGVSLLQLSGAQRAFLFRVKKTGLPKKLCRILENPKVLKIGAAVNDDIRGLKRICDFNSDGFVDLQRMVGDYGIKDKSVKKMAAIILGVKVSKSQQLSNWEAEELSEAQLQYAATDAWVCREMYLRLLECDRIETVEND